MKKVLVVLVFIALAVGQTFADDAPAKDSDSKSKTITVQGTLVDTSCYFEEGQKGDDHDGMKACGKDCLNSGIPAGVLVDDKVYILIFPAKAFADLVGETVEIKGEAYGDNLIHPKKAFVVDKNGKKPIKLTGFEMM
ncbi:MAG TPA: hypothetical protein VK791_10645 [bacterium]|nr:hypothetical protein [bacterium]